MKIQELQSTSKNITQPQNSTTGVDKEARNVAVDCIEQSLEIVGHIERRKGAILNEKLPCCGLH